MDNKIRFKEFIKINPIYLNNDEIYDYYESKVLAIAHLEKTYPEHLSILRNGMPHIILKDNIYIPPFRELTEEEISEFEKYIVNAKEHDKKTFLEAGKALNISKEKAKSIYQSYYLKKVKIAIERIEPTVNFSFKEYIYLKQLSPYKMWNIILNEYSELVKDI